MIDWTVMLLIWTAVLAAAVLRTFTGFGFALVMVPALALFLAPKEVVVLSSALALVISVMGWRNFYGVIGLGELAPLLLASAIGTAFGVALLPAIPVAIFQLFVGISVLFACLAIALVRPAEPVRLPLLPWLAGSFSGLMNGALAIPGPPMIVYALLTELEPARSRALLMAFFLCSSAMALVSYSAAGFVSVQSFKVFALALPVLWLGDRLGQFLFMRYGDDFYRRVALLTLAALGVSITLRALF